MHDYWLAEIDRGTMLTLQELAERLGFNNSSDGHQGNSTTLAMLNTIATAFERDPGGIKIAFKVLGITPSGVASFSSLKEDEKAAES